MKAKLKFVVHRWTGWTKEQPASESFEFEVVDKETLMVNPKILKQQFEDPFYTVKISVVDSNQVRVNFKGLVLMNRDETINLRNKSDGELDLSIGQSVKFSTPTMDVGVSVTVTLNEIK